MIAFLIVSLLAIVHADEACTTVPNVAPNSGPAYDQGEELNWCYGYVAADLLTQKLQREGRLSIGERIHPIALTAAFLIDDRRHPSESRAVLSTVNEVIESLGRLQAFGMKICTERDFGGPANFGNSSFAEAQNVMMETFRKSLDTASKGELCQISSQEPDQMTKVVKEMNHLATRAWFEKLMKQCRIPIPKLESESIWFPEKGKILEQNRITRWSHQANHDLQDKIDEALENGRMAAIEYQTSFMMKDRSFMHWSSIVARKKIEGVCHYQIRNSFGTDCKRYRANVRCENGYVWVSREDLINHMDTAYYLK